MDGIKFAQGTMQTDKRSGRAGTDDFCSSMENSYFSGMKT
jgi:hypothetical protein